MFDDALYGSRVSLELLELGDDRVNAAEFTEPDGGDTERRQNSRTPDLLTEGPNPPVDAIDQLRFSVRVLVDELLGLIDQGFNKRNYFQRTGQYRLEAPAIGMSVGPDYLLPVSAAPIDRISNASPITAGVPSAGTFSLGTSPELPSASK